MFTGRLTRWVTAASRALGIALIARAPALAQGCVMCKTSAAANSEAASRINLGILVLLVPVAALFIGIFAVIYRYRDSVGMTARVK